MIRTVEKYMEQYQMVNENDVIVAGVSGGADSVCLFLILEEYCKKKNARLVAVHINHGIRAEAGKDAEYVKSLCEEFQIPFHLFEKDVNQIAASAGIGTEEAGRIARYKAFEQVLQKYGGKGKIAVAHNKGDQAETVLFHLFRGSNIAGLSGIAPVRDNIIRPLLCVERKAIENFLVEKGRSWCIDSTNEENTYTRNKLRNVVFPYVEKEICPQAAAHVANAAQELSEIKKYLDEITLAAEKETIIWGEKNACVQTEPFLELHEVIQKQLILRVLEYLIPARRDISSVHISDVLSLFFKDTGKQIQLPYGFVAKRIYDRIVIERAVSEIKEKNFSVTIPGRICFESGKYMDFQVFSGNIHMDIPQKTYTKWFDYDKIINCPELRNRRSGDYLTISKDGNRKSIKEYFIEEKIPRESREDILLLADGSHVLWVVGMRISEYYKITEETKNILQVTVLDKEEYI